MKQLQKSDLKEGEIYKQLGHNYIFLYNKNETSDNFNDGTAISTTAPRYCKRWSASGFEQNMIEATLEEKHWLETCIKAAQFVPYEEAMKTFIPEYVECIIVDSLIEVGKIYKTTGLKDWPTPSNNGCTKVYTLEIGNNNPYYTSQFKPSTKEAYDAQFIVKEPEFTLPEKWQIERNKENHEIINNWMNNHHKDEITNSTNYNNSCCFVNNFNLNKLVRKQAHITEITFDQFKQYVLKENTTVTEEPKVVLEEPKDKVLAHLIQSDITLIHSVECSEGGVYRVGDKITVFDKYSPNKGKVFTIQSFRWSKNKSKICAVTELHTPNGIGLDKIELYVEPKVKFVLPEKWCVKNTDPLIYRFFDSRLNYYNSQCYNNPVHENNYLHSIDFRGNNVINSQIGANISYNYVKPDYTEITFEQFKKYVLKNE